MVPDPNSGEPAFTPLDVPRPIAPGEQDLLTYLVAAVATPSPARPAEVVVVGTCRCGCSSVQLQAPPLPGLPGHRAVGATGRGPAGQPVDVVLHLVDGRLHELEIFDPAAGEGAAVDPAAVTDLGRPGPR